MHLGKNLHWLVLALLVVGMASLGAATSFSVDTSSEWNNGNFDGTTVNNSKLQLLPETKTYDYTGSNETYDVPVDGTYEFHIYGAEGSDGSAFNQGSGGKGGAINGTYDLTSSDTVDIYVGEKGSAPSGGWGYYDGGDGGSGSEGKAGDETRRGGRVGV